jgi:hypothetical protein
MLGKLTPLLAEIDWVELIVYCGLTAAVLTVGIYLILAVRDWMATPADYDSVGDHLDSLRQALELGSMDPDEYRKAVQALQSQAEKLSVRAAEPLGSAVLVEALQRSKPPLELGVAGNLAEQETVPQARQEQPVTIVQDPVKSVDGEPERT